MHDVLDFLFDHAGHLYTPQEWCNLLNVQIIDPDGWRSTVFVETMFPPRPMSEPIGLREFIARLAVSTIHPVDPNEV
jgi:hypothetical protein